MSRRYVIYWMLCELSAILALDASHSLWVKLLLFCTAHSFASTILSIMLVEALPRQVETRRSNVIALFFSFSFFIPILGGLGMFATILYFRFFLRFDDRVEFTTVRMSSFMKEAGDPAQGMGEGGAWSRLRNNEVPRKERLKALLAIGSSGGQNTSRLIQLATMDSDDEIRLLAFNLADRREKEISSAISESLTALRSSSESSDKRALCSKLAFSYWEMVYNDLAQQELAKFYVSQSLAYALQALAIDETDSALLLLTGRLQLWRGDIEAAKLSIEAASEHGAHKGKVIPYLAEIAYRKRDFKAMRSYFALNPLLKEKPGIGPVAHFWMES